MVSSRFVESRGLKFPVSNLDRPGEKQDASQVISLKSMDELLISVNVVAKFQVK